MMRYRPGGHLATSGEEQKKHERNTDAHTVRRIIAAFRPYRFQIVLVLTTILITTLLGLVSPLIVKSIVDDALPGGNAPLLLTDGAILIVTPFVAGIIGVAQTYLNNMVGQSVMRDLRNQLYQHLQSMPLRFFTGTRTGEIQSRLSNDIGGVQGVVMAATNLVSNVTGVLSIVMAMLWISPFLTLIALGMLPLFLWVGSKAGKLRRQTSNETQKSLASLTSLMQETLSVSGILLIKVFGRQKYVEAQFEQENQNLMNQAVRQLMIGRWFFLLIGIFFSITPALIYLVAGSQLMSHVPVLGSSMTIGIMFSFVLLQSRLFLPVGQLLNLQVEIQGVQALFYRIFEYLDMPIEIQDKPNALQLKPEDVRGEVTFRGVTFISKPDEYSTLKDENSDQGKAKHRVSPKSDALVGIRRSNEHEQMLSHSESVSPREEPRLILKNISFSIKPGQLAALVGKSNAGKTMITSLLPRLYDVECGAVEIDGINVKDLALASLGELIGVVTQETHLFHASIRENLLYARPDATEAEMIAAAQAAAIHERIMELEDGYETIVGERGYKLSGSEKHHVAIARVVLKNPRLLILDEATSSLDTREERFAQSSLETLMKGRTTLAIARRLSTILAADVILVVDKGKIVERGTHKELLALGGLYARLHHERFSRLSEAETAGAGSGPASVPMSRTRLLSGVPFTSQTALDFEARRSYQQGHTQAGMASACLMQTCGASPAFYSSCPLPFWSHKKTASPTRQFRLPFPWAKPAGPAPHFLPSAPAGKEFASLRTFIPTARSVTLVKPRLIIISFYSDEMHEIALERDTLTLGEADSNNIVLGRDPLISPYHAVLKKKDEDYHLFDQNSHRGVFVNGHKLAMGEGHKLANGDQIMLGQYRLIFVDQEA
jgi:ATP-binding cassette subfamily B protein